MNRLKKSPITRGEPCKRHNCILCCLDTQIPLTREDIERLSSLKYKIEDFAVKVNEEWRLRNVDGKCYFLAKNGCKIYEFRPEGCRLYPFVYDENREKPVLDEFCPYKEEFKPQKTDFKRLLKLIDELRAGASSNSEDER